MSRRIYDGVILDNTVYMTDEKKVGFSVFGRVFQFLAIAVGCWSIVLSLLESFQIPADPGYVNIAILIAAAVIYALCLHPSFDAVKLFLSGLFYGLFLWSRLPVLKNAFFIVENLVINQLSQYYGFQNFKYKADYSTAAKDTTLLAIMFLIPIIVLLTLAIVRSRYVNLCSLILFLPVSLTFVAGILPSERYLIAYILSMLYLTKSGYSQHNKDQQQKNLLHRINSHAAIWLTMACCVLFLLMKFFVPREKYEGITEIPNMKQEIQTGLFNFTLEDMWEGFLDIKLPGRSRPSGGLNGGELGKTGKVEFTNSEQLRIMAPLQSVSEGIYLKGYVGSVYTGSEWKDHSKATNASYKKLLSQFTTKQFDPINQVSMLLENLKDGGMVLSEEPAYIGIPMFEYGNGNINIEYENANRKYMYAPYFTNYKPLKGVVYKEDLYPAPKSQKDSYEFNYNFNLEQGDPNPFFQLMAIAEPMGTYYENEKLYRSFVYQAYTELPDQGLEQLKEEFSTVAASLNGTPEKLDYVKNYLHSNTHYSLEPGKVPKGKDFVEYFLYENKLGYCAHYASAAVLMLRTMGVPARYAEGYAVGSLDITKGDYNETQRVTYYTQGIENEKDLPMVQVSVKDYNAHAWVEVYFDYCGWIPVEFTPGSVIDYNSSAINEMAAIGENLSEEEEQEKDIEPTQAPEQPTPTPAVPTVTPKPESEVKEAVSTGANNEKPEENRDRWFFLILGSGLTVVLLGLYLVRSYRRGKDQRNKDPNKRTIRLFLQAEKLLALWNALPKGGGLEDHHEYIQKHFFEADSKEFSHFIDIARRARYGKGSISAEDLEAAEIFHQKLYDRVYDSLPAKKKLYYKLILLN